MIIGLIILFISQIVLIPIVFSVQRTNNRVLSLFGYIPTREIKELAGRCERFIQKYLEDYQEKKEYSIEKSEEEEDQPEISSKRTHNENSYLEVNGHESLAPENIKVNISEGDGLEAKVAQLNKEKSLPISINERSNPDTVEPMSSPKGFESEKKPLTEKSQLDSSPQKNPKEDEKKGDEEGDILVDRTQKLLNSKDNNKRGVILQFIAVSILFVLWFVLNYVDIDILLKRVKIELNHLRDRKSVVWERV